MEHEETQQGHIIAYTGNGKGKTSAAIGAAVRMLGVGGTVLYVQFLKGAFESAERDFFTNTPNVTVVTAGGGFFMNEEQRKEQEALARNGVGRVYDALARTRYSLLILDEVNTALHERLLPLDAITRIIEERGAMHVILTGRNAPSAILDMADTVTEMREVAHAYAKGMPAVQGIDY